MFTSFYNNLRKFGLDVTLKEWLTLQEAHPRFAQLLGKLDV